MTAGRAGSDLILERLLALHPKIIDLTLGRLERLLAILGHPERSLPPVVHIAGTNGKGSTLATIRAGLEAAGKSVHAYTSPHLARFHERIRLNGALIDEPALAALLAECEAENGGEAITFFEITTAAALLAYARMPADYLLLEVGLGGRLDATNVVDRPALTVITPISYDHQQYLGESLAEIAFEKAGVLKPGVPCVVSRQTEEALEVIEAQAARVGAPLLISGQDWTATLEDGRLVYRDEAGLLDLPPPRLLGAHQIENAGAALAALRALGADETAQERAPAEATWPARLQRLKEGPLAEMVADRVALWLDGGHNGAAGEAVAGHLRASGPLHLICGMLETKDPAAFLSHFKGLAAGLVAVPIKDSQAALPPEAIAAAGEALGLSSSTAETVDDALSAALAAGASRVLICGSLYLAGEVLRNGNS